MTLVNKYWKKRLISDGFQTMTFRTDPDPDAAKFCKPDLDPDRTKIPGSATVFISKADSRPI